MCTEHPGLPRLVVQVLLAIAAGAMLVTPEWLTASVEAGEWLPEEPFLAQVCCASCALLSCIYTLASQHRDIARSAVRYGVSGSVSAVTAS